MRGIAYNTRMNRLFDKLIVLACCIAAALGLAVDARLVAAFCLGVIIAALAEVAHEERARHASEAASYVYVVAAAFVPPFAPFAPLAFYDIARRVRRERIWPALAIGVVFACTLVADLRGGALATRTLLLTAILSVAATLLSLRTAQLEREQERMRRTRDRLQERALALEARNRDLADRQDYEVELATLAERARIAREIHDNVGHQLTRAKLQTDALAIVHEADPAAAADFQSVGRAVDEALSLVRASVHDLHDDSFDLGLQAHKAADAFMRGSSVRVAVEVSCEHVPANVGACLLAVMREAMSNALRHGRAGRIEVRCLEHPALWQLSVLDDGGARDGMAAGAAGTGASADQTAISGQFHTSGGMGLASMRERVEALSGSFSAGPRRDSAGWRVFASIPKERAGAA